MRNTRKLQALALIFFGAVFLPLIVFTDSAQSQSSAPTEAPTGFDNLTNGLVTQTEFDLAKAQFEEVQTIDSGLGPVYNAQSCGECHQNRYFTNLPGGSQNADGDQSGQRRRAEQSRQCADAPESPR